MNICIYVYIKPQIKLFSMLSLNDLFIYINIFVCSLSNLEATILLIFPSCGPALARFMVDFYTVICSFLTNVSSFYHVERGLFGGLLLLTFLRYSCGFYLSKYLLDPDDTNVGFYGRVLKFVELFNFKFLYLELDGAIR